MEKTVLTVRALLYAVFYGLPIAFFAVSNILYSSEMAMVQAQHYLADILQGTDRESAGAIFYLAYICVYIVTALFWALILVTYQSCLHVFMYSFKFGDGLGNFISRSVASSWFFTLAVGAPLMCVLAGLNLQYNYLDYYLWTCIVIHVLIQHRVHMKSMPAK